MGTMSTIYSVGDEESASMTVKQKMREIDPTPAGRGIPWRSGFR